MLKAKYYKYTDDSKRAGNYFFYAGFLHNRPVRGVFGGDQDVF